MVRAGLRSTGSPAIQLSTSSRVPTAATLWLRTNTLPPRISRRWPSMVTTASALAMRSDVMDAQPHGGRLHGALPASSRDHAVAQSGVAQVVPVRHRHAVAAYRQLGSGRERQAFG